MLSFSPFNGMRTLSANIAVEIPEAPLDETLLPHPFPHRLPPLRPHLRRQHRGRDRPPTASRKVQGRLSLRAQAMTTEPQVAAASALAGHDVSRGEHWMWLTGAALAAASSSSPACCSWSCARGRQLLAPPLTQADLADGSSSRGPHRNRDLRGDRSRRGGMVDPRPIQFKSGNRDVFGADFVWYETRAHRLS